jgi:two-component system, NarL family, invasion response regulator UvrY
MIRVMLVDDHALVRMGFRMLLADAHAEVVAEAGSGEEACQQYAGVKPDVVVMDLSMPGMGGLEAVRRLIAQDPKARILALSAHEDTAHPRRVLRAGALGYLAKRSAPDALIVAVQAVARGERYVDAQTAQALAMAQIDGEASPADTLSEREFSVFIQLARGMSVAQIAEVLNLSPSTVGTHLYHVKQKLNAGNQSELTLVALRWGLIQA